MPLLTIDHLTMNFSGLTAINDLSFTVPRGHIVSLIGPNGAGKTTVFNCISKFYTWTSGQIHFREQSLTPLPPYQIASLGIARTFQNIRLFPDMSLLDNIRVGQHARLKGSVWGALLRPPAIRKEEALGEKKAKELLKFVKLLDRAEEPAKNLPYGDQRRLEIARALATEPLLLMLDEPAAGMNPQETAQLIDLIQHIKHRGITLLLIEHDMKLVMGISDHIVVMNFGIKIAEGKPQAIQQNPEVIEAYLGGMAC